MLKTAAGKSGAVDGMVALLKSLNRGPTSRQRKSFKLPKVSQHTARIVDTLAETPFLH